MPKTAYRIRELAEAGPFKKTFIFAAIANGRLTARKAGAATVVLASDWEDFLANLPKAGPEAKAS
jgi:hypothetical protein